MFEYGGVTRQGSGGSGSGGGGGSFDVGGAVMDTITDLFDRAAALPPEILVLFVAALMIGGLVLQRR